MSKVSRWTAVTDSDSQEPTMGSLVGTLPPAPPLAGLPPVPGAPPLAGVPPAPGEPPLPGVPPLPGAPPAAGPPTPTRRKVVVPLQLRRLLPSDRTHWK